MHANEAYVTQALSAGAAGYVTKETDIANLVQAVHEVASGGHYLSPPISGLVIEAYLKKRQGGSLDPYDTLTERERQVLRIAAESSSIAEIAARLSVSPRTVENHRANLMRKLSHKGWAWDCPSAVRSLKRTTGGCGQHRTPRTE
jgi:DNA-binding NarL/FixJ family response regulator